MTEQEAHNLTHTLLKKIQADVAELKQIRQEMREGFASMKSHTTGLIGDVYSHERRMLNIENEILRLKSHLGLEDDTPSH